MLSVETESKLAKIFLTLAEGEKTIDINRQILVELQDFDPFKIFSYLDTNQKNYLNNSDLLNYCTEKGITTNDLEINLLIFFYDMDYDGVLSYPEFAYFIQSDYSKRGVIKNDNNNAKENSDLNNINLSPSIEQALNQLFSNEINLIKNILSQLNDLKQRFDFNIHELYHAVKNYNFIEENSLRNFFERNKISFLESDIRKIMKRLDLNGDGKIDFCEFHAFLGFPDCQLCCPVEECKCCGICCCNMCLCDVPCFVHNLVHVNVSNEPNSINNINEKEDEEENNFDSNRQDMNRKKINESNENNLKNNIENEINKNKLNLINYKKNKTNMENLNSNLEKTANYNFNYNGDKHQMEESNIYLGHVSDNLILRLCPQRRHSPGPCRINHYHENHCIPNDFCCEIYNQIPCEKCIHNHYILYQENSTSTNINKSNYINEKCKPCEMCNSFPCCCCSVCHFYPCKCCAKCHSIRCKCCKRCSSYPCKCCPECKSPSCKCCPNCKTFPCKCCPICHLEQCICCKVCHKYPCKCCPQCHFDICKCCKICHQYPCACCPVCHMAECICCENCENYPCKCCPDCHFVECQCCINCGCYPCKCGYLPPHPNPCNLCCQMCGDIICEECLSNPCRCCPLCHEDKCGCPKCEHEKEFIKSNIDNIKCPMHNAHSMKHNHGCPYEVKCYHEPKCAHKNIGKRNINQMNNSNYSSNNNSRNLNNMNIGNSNNQMFNNISRGNNNNFCPHHNNINQNNSLNYNNRMNQRNNNSSQNNIPYNNNEENNNNIQYNNNYQNNNEENNNSIPYNENSGQYNPNNNNIQDNGENEPNNYSDNENYEEQNENDLYNENQEIEGPLSPLSSPFPPDSPFFNIPGPKSNWIFCPNCNLYHRCPHPGCDHSPNKRTTTHKCIHEKKQPEINSNQNSNINSNINTGNNINNNSLNNQNSNVTPNFNNNKQNIIFPNSNNSISFNQNKNLSNKLNNNINNSQSNKSTSSKKRGVFSSCPYQDELSQFVDFLGLLMEVESKIEDMKIDLAQKADFNFEDIFRIFEVDGKGYIEPEDLKQGLKLLGLNPSDFDIKLLMKRFDLNHQNLLSYTDFFDMVVSFEKKMRNNVQIRPPNSCCSCKSPDIFECDTLIAIKNLFQFIIECEREINQRRAEFDSLRSKYAEVIKFLDYSKRGVINRSDLKLYLTQFNIFTTSKECDLLFIRLDRTRTGEVNINEIEDELMFLR